MWDKVKKEHVVIFIIILGSLIIFNYFDEEFQYNGLAYREINRNEITGYGFIDVIKNFFLKLIGRKAVGGPLDCSSVSPYDQVTCSSTPGCVWTSNRGGECIQFTGDATKTCTQQGGQLYIPCSGNLYSDCRVCEGSPIQASDTVSAPGQTPRLCCMGTLRHPSLVSTTTTTTIRATTTTTTITLPSNYCNSAYGIDKTRCIADSRCIWLANYNSQNVEIGGNCGNKPSSTTTTTIAPSLTIQHQAVTRAYTNQNIEIIATVTSNYQVPEDGVNLRYRANGGGQQSLRMFKTSGNNYKATIPALTNPGSITYYIDARDNNIYITSPVYNPSTSVPDNPYVITVATESTTTTTTTLPQSCSGYNDANGKCFIVGGCSQRCINVGCTWSASDNVCRDSSTTTTTTSTTIALLSCDAYCQGNGYANGGCLNDNDIINFKARDSVVSGGLCIYNYNIPALGTFSCPTNTRNCLCLKEVVLPRDGCGVDYCASTGCSLTSILSSGNLITTSCNQQGSITNANQNACSGKNEAGYNTFDGCKDEPTSTVWLEDISLNAPNGFAKGNQITATLKIKTLNNGDRPYWHLYIREGSNWKKIQSGSAGNTHSCPVNSFCNKDVTFTLPSATGRYILRGIVTWDMDSDVNVVDGCVHPKFVTGVTYRDHDDVLIEVKDASITTTSTTIAGATTTSTTLVQGTTTSTTIAGATTTSTTLVQGTTTSTTLPPSGLHKPIIIEIRVIESGTKILIRWKDPGNQVTGAIVSDVKLTGRVITGDAGFFDKIKEFFAQLFGGKEAVGIGLRNDFIYTIERKEQGAQDYVTVATIRSSADLPNGCSNNECSFIDTNIVKGKTYIYRIRASREGVGVFSDYTPEDQGTITVVTEICNNGKDDDNDNVVDRLDVDCINEASGAYVYLKDIEVSNEEPYYYSSINVKCSFGVGNESLDSVHRSNCVKARIGNNECSNSRLIRSEEVIAYNKCNIGNTIGQTDVVCYINPDCNSVGIYRKIEVVRSIDIRKFDYCSNGVIGSDIKSLSIKNIKENDTIKGGTLALIKISLRSDDINQDDLDIGVSSGIVDLSDGSILVEGSDKAFVKYSKNQDYVIELNIPDDFDTSHVYRLFVKAYKLDDEENSCVEATRTIKLKKSSTTPVSSTTTSTTIFGATTTTTIYVPPTIPPDLTTTTVIIEDGEDIDNDGLPDEWEIRYFNSLEQNADDDFDLDSSTNIEEFEAGTDPTDPESKPGGGIPLYVWIIVIVVVIIIIVLVIFMRGGGNKYKPLGGPAFKENFPFEEKSGFKTSTSAKNLNQLKGYIIKSKAKGFTKTQIKSALLAKGWTEKEIEDAFKE